MPDDIMLEIFQAVARADPDGPLMLSEVCVRWRILVLNTSRLWTNVHIMVNHKEVPEALGLFFLLSRSLPLEITLKGVQMPRLMLDELVFHGHRIRSLDIRLQKDAREPFRVLGNEVDGGLRTLSRLAVVPLDDKGREREKTSGAPPARARKAKNNALGASDMSAIQLLPALHSLTALVLHDMGTTQTPPMELPRLESLTLALENLPTVLQNLRCDSLRSLDITLDNTSRDGWWNLLLCSLAHSELRSLSLDVTLDRSRDDWTGKWDSRFFKRLPSHIGITKLIVALSFADGQYLVDDKATAEYLCGDILDEFVACFTSLEELQLVHVPFFYAPFIWPSPQILDGLRRLELQVPAIVHESPPVIELPNLRELRYHGYINIKVTELRTLSTPLLECLEIVHYAQAINPIAPHKNRHWPGDYRRPIGSPNYSIRQRNSAKDFPLEAVQLSDRYLRVIHQSALLQKLILYFGDPLDQFQEQPEFRDTEFPELRVLHCSGYALWWVRAPRLEELHLLWTFDNEWGYFPGYQEDKYLQQTLKQLKVLDVYSNFDPQFHRNATGSNITYDGLLTFLDSLELILLPQGLPFLNLLIDSLIQDPHLCPNLTTIKSFGYPNKWSSLIDCIELRNHLAMENPSIKAIQKLCFPLALHPHIAERLKEALSGQFSAPLVAIPNQPWAFNELLLPSERKTLGSPLLVCAGCRKSGQAFECMRQAFVSDFNCSRHTKRAIGAGAEVTASATILSGYLETDKPRAKARRFGVSRVITGVRQIAKSVFPPKNFKEGQST
jgi:hypothetical protein